MKPAFARALAVLLVGCAAPARTPPAASAGARPSGTMKAALDLLVARHPEDAEMLSLMDQVPGKDSGNDASTMASFLHILAADRRRMRETAAARARDERRALEAMRSRADAAQERAAQLQQKLDALTELEKTLSERQTSSR